MNSCQYKFYISLLIINKILNNYKFIYCKLQIILIISSPIITFRKKNCIRFNNMFAIYISKLCFFYRSDFRQYVLRLLLFK